MKPNKANFDKNKFEINKLTILKEISKTAFNYECQREITIRNQASNMQSAFSFVVAAITMCVPVILQYRGVLSLWYLLIVFSSIYIVLLSSLLCATLVQKLMKEIGFSNLSENINDFSLKLNMSSVVVKRKFKKFVYVRYLIFQSSLLSSICSDAQTHTERNLRYNREENRNISLTCRRQLCSLF